MQQFFPFAGDIKTISPLSLAYVGDGVYELMIRERLIGRETPPKGAHGGGGSGEGARPGCCCRPGSSPAHRRGAGGFPPGDATPIRPGGYRRTRRWRSTTRLRRWNACSAGSTLKGDGERLRALFEEAVKEEAET